MNYINIYNDFIKSRRINPPVEGEYYEKHHILPRCLGGGDNPENLIQLIPEDHFFAHLLLAKAHNKFQLWSSIRLMMGVRAKHGKVDRHKYGWLKRKCALSYLGNNNPSYKKEIITLKHTSGLIDSRTRLEWAKTEGLRTAICGLLQGYLLSMNGWMLPETESSLIKIGKKMNYNKVALKNISGLIEEHTRIDWINIKGFKRQRLYKLLNGERLSYQGWMLPKTEPSITGMVRRGDKNGNYKPEKITLFNINGRVASYTREEWRGKEGFWNSDIANLLNGKRKSIKGWSLKTI